MKKLLSMTEFPPRELLHTAVMLNNRITNVICSPESLYNEIEQLSVERCSQN